MRGRLRTPFSGEITGAGSDKPSAGDITLIDTSTGGFVQFGWYLGSASGLPTVSTPHLFVGENIPGTTGEALQGEAGVGWGTYNLFSIQERSPGYYGFYLNGTYWFSTTYKHFNSGDARAVGEVDNDCTVMAARAFEPSPPNRTLQYRTQNTSGYQWNYFLDHRYASAGFESVPVSDIATDYAYGP
ncbi:MAG TPA: hypothetical protein VFI30_02385 [Nocardioidaceae bacterium]|nr:hypothetical protein [Nocardioidaceae bacterium]